MFENPVKWLCVKESEFRTCFVPTAFISGILNYFIISRSLMLSSDIFFGIHLYKNHFKTKLCAPS